MISKFAMDEIDAMKEAGLDPSPRDIVRLNALGLKIDHGDGDDALYQSRRTATVEDVTLHEPTIGHELYLADMRHRGFDMDDGVTFVVARAWVLSFADAADLPRTWTVPGIRRVIGEFMERHFCRVTFNRLTMAVNYVLFGYSSVSLERPVPAPSEAEERTADDEAVDDMWNFALGVLHAGQVHRLGISLADARKLTVAEMSALVNQAMENDLSLVPGGRKAMMDTRKNKYLGQFFATKESIVERLKKEKENGTEHQI